MKLTHIEAQNVMGISAVSVALSTPVTLFAGANGQGKSSLAEAVRMALGGDVKARGVALKKDLAALVHDGAKSGSIEVTLADGLVTFALLPSDKITPADAYTPHRALPFVLEPHRFAALDACGNPNWMYCVLCKQYDAPESLYVSPNRVHAYHRSCSATYARSHRVRTKGSNQ